MIHLLSGGRKLLGLRMLLREQDYPRVAGKLFILFRPRPRHQKRLVVEGKRGAGVKSLYYLFVGMLYQVLQSLVARVSFQILQ